MSELEDLASRASAVSNVRRLQLLELLKEQSLSVEQLSKRSGLSVANTSQHLQILRRAGLVTYTRMGKHLFYELQDRDEYLALISSLRAISQRQHAVIRQLRADYLCSQEKLQPISREQLQTLIASEQVTIIDVRPKEEYERSHIIGALNIPLGELAIHLNELPTDMNVVAYCRGPNCILSYEAVNALQALGYKARRLEDGPVQWQAAGLTQTIAEGGF